MKSLKQFIKESQYIDESLIGDIVRKLLDTGLSWIEGSVKWIANKSTDAVGDVWKTHRDVLTTTYSDFRRTYPQYKFLPETPKTPQEYMVSDIEILFDERISADAKINYANDLINKVKKRKGSKPGAIEAYIAQKTANCYVGIIKNPNATDVDKVKADKFLNTVISSNTEEVKELTEEKIKELKGNIK